jgi:hypothetical protein
MKRSASRLAIVLTMLGLAACVPTYTLVSPGAVPVSKQSFTVNPESAWNRVPKFPGELDFEESWTRNGPLLDVISFVGSLPDGGALVVQKQKDDRQVPLFHSDMGPNDLVSMAESYYRVRGGIEVFNVTGVQPVSFLGASGLQMDFNYVGRDNLPRKGRILMSVVDGKLYLMKLEGAASHYFDASAPEFDAMAKSATIAGR